MSKSMQRDLIAGELAGLIAGIVFALALQFQSAGVAVYGLLGLPITGTGLIIHLLAATLAGGLFGALFRYSKNAYAGLASSGVLFGLVLWILGPLTIEPLIMSATPSWNLSAAQAAFPSLIGHLLYGGLMGFSFYVIGSILNRVAGEATAEHDVDKSIQHAVILGGGFGGVEAAKKLGDTFARDRNVSVTLVSDSDYLLFTPMLAEVASSALQPQHISVPVREAAPNARHLHASVESIDTDAQTVRVRELDTGRMRELSYSQLVLGLGSVPNYLGLEGIEENSFTLKTLGDAAKLREHVLRLLSIADQEIDPQTRRELLTFVVIGGGFAGSETISELFDLVHSVLHYYGNISGDDPRFVLVHSRDRILPEIGKELAQYAQARLKARGIEIFLERRAARATAHSVLLDDGTEIPNRTLVWTAGNRPHPLLKALDCKTNKAGAVVADEKLRVEGLENIWAVGDCAQIPDPAEKDRACPPTAQHALRQGSLAAANVAAMIRGNPGAVRPFEYKTQGTLVVLGRFTAVAEIMGVRFSGLIAWLLWRAIYLSKLPGLQKKLRVLIDWNLDMFFPRDIALIQTEITDDPRYYVHELEPIVARDKATSLSQVDGQSGEIPA